LNNTPRQMNMLLALGARPPVYAHLPMILGADGAKLSKRHGAVSVLQYRDEGFLAEAVLNYLVRLGWSHGDQEIFSIDEMIRLFDIDDVNKSAAAFNFEKLGWLNQQHLMRAPPSRIAPLLRWHLEQQGIETSAAAPLEDIVVAQRERARTLKEMALNSAFFFRAPHSYDDKAVRKHVTADVLPLLGDLTTTLEALPEWSSEAIHRLIGDLAASKGLSLGKLAQPVRLAVCGGTISPPIDATLAILGKSESLERLRRARTAWGG
jgi:glutamyl-tRNA synthetase